MMLAVAGLNDEELKTRTKRLATGQWDSFTPAERQAYAFAAKLSATPWAIGQADMQQLSTTFGSHRAIDLLWYASWTNYMTRVADAFQLPLERENVFQPPEQPKTEQPKKP
jgi:alkylhydroperoxidase family enzyme